MRKTAVAVVVGLVALAASLPVSAALAGGRPFSTELTGAQEAPGPGDADASGSAFLTVNPGQEEVCYELTWSDVDGTVTAAHIHEAPAGEPGPVVVGLFSGQSFSGTGSHSDCVSGDRDVLVAILQNPENYYVNVHSTVFPPGAIRGQLSR